MIFGVCDLPALWPIDTTRKLCYPHAVNLGERYQQLCLLGRSTFLESVADAALVIQPVRTRMARGTREPTSSLADEALLTTVGERDQVRGPGFGLAMEFGPQPMRSIILALAKKKNTPFVDLITIGRTPSNDVTLSDPSVSRFQAFFRCRFGRWYLCDAGSRNGTRVDRDLLKPRTEVEVQSGQKLHFGVLETTFHTADSLFDLLASRSSL